MASGEVCPTPSRAAIWPLTLNQATAATNAILRIPCTSRVRESVENRRLKPRERSRLSNLGVMSFHATRPPVWINPPAAVARSRMRRNGPRTAAPATPARVAQTRIPPMSPSERSLISRVNSSRRWKMSEPNECRSRRPARSATAADRSVLRASCPSSRASWRRRGVGASVFSPASSATLYFPDYVFQRVYEYFHAHRQGCRHEDECEQAFDRESDRGHVE